MTSTTDDEMIVKLHVIAALASNAANKLAAKQMWPGDLADALAMIRKTLAEIKE